MITKDELIRDMERLIAKKQTQLETLYPDNPFTTEFMEDVEKAERRVTIDLLKTHIRELNITLNYVRQL